MTDQTGVTATASLPRLRTDLAVSRQATASGEIVVLKDPDRDRFFRLPPEAHFIAGQLDGATPLETVRSRVEARFRAPLPAGALEDFVRRLDDAGLLESSDRGRSRKRRRLAGSLLYLRYRLLDPDGILDRIAGPLRFLFTPGFVAVSASAMLAAGGLAAANWGEVLATLPQFYRLSSIPLISAVIFAMITLHEFGHGLTCKHFGGRVREMGFLLIYFQPALYCNVSDAWLFPEKSRRLWVGLAGPWIEMFAWSLAVLAWRVTDGGTVVNQVAYIAMASSGIKILFNFNPLIKLDGYYLLSDWLEVPNLRGKAFAWLGAAIRHWSGFADDPPPEAAPRERRIYLAYGLVASVGSFAFLGLALHEIGGYLVDQSQPLLLAVFTALVGAVVHRRWTRLFALTAESAGDAGPNPPAAENPPPAAPGTQARGIPPPGEPRETRSRRRRSRAAPRLKLLLLAVLTLALLFVVRVELRIAGAFDALPHHNADVRTAVSGIVAEVLVDEGDSVRAGDVVARLTGRDERAQLSRTLAAIEKARARLALLEAGPTPEEIEVAKTAVTRATDRLAFARTHLARADALVERGLITAREHDESRQGVKLAQNDVAEAEARLDVVLAGTRPEEVAAARAEVAGLVAERTHLEEVLRLLEVRSPASGIITTPSRTLHETVHRLVQKGDLVAKVHELDTVTAQIVVSEKDIGDVRVGQEVRLKARAYPELMFDGRVTAIAAAAVGGASPSGPDPAATAAPAARTVLVTTEIENRDRLLKPAMTGQAKIYCGERRLIEVLFRRFARTVRVEFWSWW